MGRTRCIFSMTDSMVADRGAACVSESALAACASRGRALAAVDGDAVDADAEDGDAEELRAGGTPRSPLAVARPPAATPRSPLAVARPPAATPRSPLANPRSPPPASTCSTLL